MNSRPLRFRIWDPNSTPHGRWIGIETFIGDGYGDLNDDETLVFSQFTGLTDSKGVDIYEGDVVNLIHVSGRSYRGQVVYDNYAWHANLNGWFVPFAELSKSYSRFSTIGVVGNVFETPDLIATPSR